MATTLYVWKISPTNVGHVALQVDDVHMSYWPSEAAGKNDVKPGDTHDVMFPRSYAHGRKLERKPADARIQMWTPDDVLRYANEIESQAPTK